MLNKLNFFNPPATREHRKYEDFVRLAENIVSQSRILLAATEDEDAKQKLNKIIHITLAILKSLQDNVTDQTNQLLYDLNVTSMSLPPEITSKNRLGSMSKTLANLCLFVVALSLAWFTGYVFFAAYYAISLQAVADAFIWTCAFDLIPFGLVGLFARSTANSASPNASVSTLQELISVYSLTQVDDVPAIEGLDFDVDDARELTCF